MLSMIKNEIGKKYGKLTVIERGEPDGKGVRWLCKCECGRLHTARGVFLRNSMIKSCGCSRAETCTLPDGQAAKNHAYSSYRRAAARRSILFTLTLEEFLKLTSLPCFYCGRLPSNIMKSASEKSKNFVYQGIDRENSHQGYTRSNSVPCCFVCNKMKGTKSHIEFLNTITNIYRYSIAP